jgi:hypothetical protein
MNDLAPLIGDKVDDYIDPVTNRPEFGLKSRIKDRVGLMWEQDELRMDMFYEALIKAAEQAQKDYPPLTAVDFLVAAKPRIIKAQVKRRSSESYDIEEYSAVIRETVNVYLENELQPPQYIFEGGLYE